nr:AT-hook motif nuclear-localized protein 20-like [Ipomoea batatas]
MANPWWTGQIGLRGVVEASSSGGAPGLKKSDLGISAGGGREAHSYSFQEWRGEHISLYVCMWISSIHSSAVLFKGFVFFHFQDIPTYFLAKYLKGQAPKFAILRRGDRSLRVKIRENLSSAS